MDNYLTRKIYFDDVWKLDKEILARNKVSKVVVYDYGDVLQLLMNINKDGYATSYRYFGQRLKTQLGCGNRPDTMKILYNSNYDFEKIKSIPSPLGFGDIEYSFNYDNANLTYVENTSDGKFYEADSIQYSNGKPTCVLHFYNSKYFRTIPSCFFYSPDSTQNHGKPEIGGDFEIYAMNKDSIVFSSGTTVLEMTTLKNNRIETQYFYRDETRFGTAYLQYFYKQDGLIQFIKIKDWRGDIHTRFYEYEYYSE